MSISRHPQWGEFVRAFNDIARRHHRYEVFRDFVTISAISLHNAVHKDEALEAEYLRIVPRYSKEELDGLCRLLGRLVVLLDTEPQDVLGPLYMELELGNTNTGQFFTPAAVSELMAGMLYGDDLKTLTKPFVTVSEPACGAGGMILAFVKIMLSHGHDPAKRMWVQCQDIDRTAALMCYLQLALWNVPGVVIVGNTLAMEAREVFYTPAHYLGGWHWRLKRRDQAEEAGEAESADPSATEQGSTDFTPVKFGAALVKQPRPSMSPGDSTPGQFDFDF